MKIVQKIKFDRVKEFKIFKKFKSKFLKNKSKRIELNKINGIYNVDDFSKLNFYIILEYINLVSEKINYKKIFPDNKNSSNSIVDFNSLVKEQEKLKTYIQDNHNKGPIFFKKLGILNEVIGCYFLCSTYNNSKRVKSFDFKNNNSNDKFLFLKFDLNQLPKEFEKICFNYQKKHNIEKDKEEVDRFLDISNEEYDVLMESLFNDIKHPLINEDMIESVNKESPATATTIQFAAENQIGKINDIDFLDNMLHSSEDLENYELCAKIRDRILEIKKKM